MPRPKLDTVNSIVKSGDALTFEIIRERDGERVLQKRNMDMTGVLERWLCGCGAKGLRHLPYFPKHAMFTAWVRHVRTKHPEYDV